MSLGTDLPVQGGVVIANDCGSELVDCANANRYAWKSGRHRGSGNNAILDN